MKSHSIHPQQVPALKHLYIPLTSDYEMLMEDDIGVCEVNGNSEYRRQEDAVMIDASYVSLHYMRLPVEQRKTVTNKTFAELQQKIEKSSHISSAGSCACVATGLIENGTAKVSTSYVGDSVAFLVVLNAEGVLKSITPCNPELHDGNNEMERFAIENGIQRAVGIIEKHDSGEGPLRLDGRLAVTRALGDVSYDDKGISHLPQTTDVTSEVKQGDQVYMVVTCDGAMEYCKGENSVASYAHDLGALIAKHHSLPPNKLATEIVDHALACGSADNITAMVVPLKEGKAITAGVFDGHSGSAVADFLMKNFNDTFEKNVFSVINSDTFDYELKRLLFPSLNANKTQAFLKKYQSFIKKDQGTERKEIYQVVASLSKHLTHEKWASGLMSVAVGSALTISLGLRYGAELGAFFGSMLPGIGTIGGSMLGGIVFGALGGMAGVCLNAGMKWVDNKVIAPSVNQLKSYLANNKKKSFHVGDPNTAFRSTVADLAQGMKIELAHPLAATSEDKKPEVLFEQTKTPLAKEFSDNVGEKKIHIRSRL